MRSSYESLPTFVYPVRISKFENYRSADHVHWHEETEILYFTNGEGIISCDLKERQVRAGDIVFINSKELHTGCLRGKDIKYYCIHTDTGFFSNRIGREYVVFQNIISDTTCAQLLDKVIEENEKGGFKSLVMVEKLMYEFFCVIAEAYVSSVFDEEEYKNNFKKLDTFNSIIEYIDRHFGEELNVHILAGKFFMSDSYFSHLFKKRSNKSVISYINEVRISRAASLLERENLAIGEIACLVGFGDINYFSRKFKALTGMTPGEYRGKFGASHTI